jgi:hypothetical protein
VAQIAKCIHPPEEHRGAARIGRAKIVFLSATTFILHPCLNMRMYFIVLTKGIFFEALSTSYKQGIAVAAAVVRAPQELERACVVHGDLV